MAVPWPEGGVDFSEGLIWPSDETENRASTGIRPIPGWVESMPLSIMATLTAVSI